MKFPFFSWLLILLGAAQGAFHDTNTVEGLTTDWAEAVVNKDAEKIVSFFDGKSTISFQTELPMGGKFEGEDGAKLMYARFMKTFQDEVTSSVEAMKVNEANGLALVKINNEGVLAHNSKELDLSLLNILEWNVVTGKVINLIIVDTNMENTMEGYETGAEKQLRKMVWDFFKTSDPETLIDGTAELWDKVADDVQLKIHSFPASLGKTEWNGKQEVIEAYKEMNELYQKSPLWNMLKKKIYMFDKDILWSDEHNVFLMMKVHKDHPVAIVRYMFDDEGRLALEEIFMAGPSKPWLIYPWPIPPQTGDAESSAGEFEGNRRMIQPGDVYTADPKRTRSGANEMQRPPTQRDYDQEVQEMSPPVPPPIRRDFGLDEDSSPRRSSDKLPSSKKQRNKQKDDKGKKMTKTTASPKKKDSKNKQAKKKKDSKKQRNKKKDDKDDSFFTGMPKQTREREKERYPRSTKDDFDQIDHRQDEDDKTTKDYSSNKKKELKNKKNRLKKLLKLQELLNRLDQNKSP